MIATQRRWMKVTVGIASSLVLLGGCDWPQFRGSATRSGFNMNEGCCNQANAISTDNAANLHQLWQAPIGDPLKTYQHYYAGNPVLAGNKVFVNGGDGNLHAYQWDTGVELWSASVTGGNDWVTGQTATPAATASFVYVAQSQSSGPPNQVYAFSTNGALSWSATVSGVNGLSSPGLVGANLYLSTTTGVSALAASSGATVWTSNAGAATTWTVVDTAVYYGTGGVVKALDLSTGQVLWTSPAFGGVVNDLAISNGKLFGRFGSTLRALDATNGTSLWAAAGITATSAPAIDNGQVYIATGNGAVRSFDATTGAQNWMTAAGSPIGVTVANGVLFTAGPNRAFNAANGVQLINIGNLGASTDAPVGNGVYLISNTYTLFAYVA